MKDAQKDNDVVNSNTPPAWLIFNLQILAYAIPLSFLLYALYINHLPFGYDKTFILYVGSEGDTDSSQPFYLEPSRSLSERKIANDSSTYRELNGIASFIFKADIFPQGADVTLKVEGEGISIIPPVINFNPDDYDWDYNWDFSQGKTPEELGLTGKAFPFDGSMYFDGSSHLQLFDSVDKFENGAFSVYAEWTPVNDRHNSQQIIGHYNWEIYQDSNQIRFRIGRTNDINGLFYHATFPIDESFFNQTNSLLARYSPATPESTNGFIELYINGVSSGPVSIGSDIIFTDYGYSPLSIGKSSHANARFLKGNISKLLFKNGIVPIGHPVITFTNQTESGGHLRLNTQNQTNLKSIQVHVSK